MEAKKSRLLPECTKIVERENEMKAYFAPDVEVIDFKSGDVMLTVGTFDENDEDSEGFSELLKGLSGS